MVIQRNTYEDFVKDLEGRLKTPRPLRGHIELTHRCNLDCIHCYCQGSESGNGELRTQQWKDIFDQIRQEGCLWLTLTGGEPLLRDDFPELYAYLRRKGFFVTIFTNATVFSSDVFKILKRYPPFLIEISLYGVTKNVYESVTQVSGSFPKVRENLNTLLQMKMPLVLKTVGLRQNKNEILKVKALAEKILGKKKFKFDAFLIPRLNGDQIPCRYRLSPEEILEIERGDEDMLAQHQEELHGSPGLLRAREFLYQCDSWRESFFINPYGRLQFCLLSQKYSCDLKKRSFKDGFYHEFPKLWDEKFTTAAKCKACRLRPYCHFCPARAFIETGDQEGRVEYYCRLAKDYFKQRQLLKP